MNLNVFLAFMSVLLNLIRQFIVDDASPKFNISFLSVSIPKSVMDDIPGDPIGGSKTHNWITQYRKAMTCHHGFGDTSLFSYWIIPTIVSIFGVTHEGKLNIGEGVDKNKGDVFGGILFHLHCEADDIELSLSLFRLTEMVIGSSRILQ
jgi:hypothetical protein